MNITIHKHNSITDGLLKLSLPAEKLLNALYHTWEREGYEDRIMTLEMADLKALIEYNSNDDELLLSYLKELTFSHLWRNFEHKGRGVKYHGGPFMSFTVYKDRQNLIDFQISSIVVSALKQKAGYTAIELEHANKFKTIYGLKLWQMYRRYKTLPSNHAELHDVGHIKKTLEELNGYFGSKYEALSQLERSMARGVKEIEKITGEYVHITKADRGEKAFYFSWEKPKPKYLETEKNFIAYIRKNFVSRELYRYKTENATVIVYVDRNGKLYDLNNQSKNFSAKESKEIWAKMYELAKLDKLLCLKQGELF